MTDLITQIERYGQAMADVHDESKSYGVRMASKDLAAQLLDVIRLRVRNLEKGR